MQEKKEEKCENIWSCQKKAVPLHPISNEIHKSRSRAVVARQAHNLKVVGSIPSSATREKPSDIHRRWLFVL